MKNLTKTELKEIMKRALFVEFGFSPALNKITLLEASGDGTYILASVNGFEYSFTSRRTLGAANGVFIGRGCIERVDFN